MELAGFADAAPNAALRRRHGLDACRAAPGLVAIAFATPSDTPARRVARIGALRRDLPGLLPVARAKGGPRALSAAEASTIAADLARLAGLWEAVVTLSYPLSCGEPGGGAAGYLARRAAANRAAADRAAAAAAALDTLADAAGAVARTRRVHPFVDRRGGRAGADLALLVAEDAVPALHAALAREARRRIPDGAGVRCGFAGPLPPFGFVSPLPATEEADARRTARP